MLNPVATGPCAPTAWTCLCCGREFGANEEVGIICKQCDEEPHFPEHEKMDEIDREYAKSHDGGTSGGDGQ